MQTLKVNTSGFTLIELLVVVAIMAITLIITIDLFIDSYTRQKLRQVAWSMYSDLKYAQSLSIAKNITINLNYRTGSDWCYGFSDSSTCNCNTTNNCTINGSEKVDKAANYSNVTLAVSGFTTSNLVFEPARGLTTTGIGSFIFSKGNFSIQVQINDINRVLLCSNNISGFPACS